MLHKLIVTISTVALVLAMTLIPVASSQAQQQVCTVWHHVQRGDTLYRIGRQYGISITGIQSINGMGTSTRIYAGQNLCVQSYIQTPAGTSYTVQRGDTLARIARHYGVNMWSIARANRILNLNHIYTGQVLTIPSN